MTVRVQFDRNLSPLTGCEQTTASVRRGTTVGTLHDFLIKRFPKLGALRASTRAVIASRPCAPAQVLQEGDQVLFSTAEEAPRSPDPARL